MQEKLHLLTSNMYTTFVHYTELCKMHMFVEYSAYRNQGMLLVLRLLY